MLEELRQRAAKMRAQNAFLVSMKGSGHHPDDKDFRNQLCAPQCQHLPLGQNPGADRRPPISEHLIAFYDRRDVIFLSGHTDPYLEGDAERVIRAVKEFAAPILQRITADPMAVAELTGQARKICYDVLPRLAVEDGVLRIWRQDWNDVLEVFDRMVIGTTGAPLKPDGTTP